MGGLLAKKRFAEKLVPGTHAATFGGNPIACSAALATIETIEKDELLPRAAKIADAFRARFEALQKRCPLIQEIRVKGTMIGIELTIDGTPLVDECLKRQLLINCTHGNVLRLLPALNLPDDALKAGCDIMEGALLSVRT
jgi:acetylornithine/N-succinyldiaminopimelate aminotransferase